MKETMYEDDDIIVYHPEEDVDTTYERMRDRACDALEADIKAVITKHSTTPGYYHGNWNKAIAHAISDLVAMRD